MSINVLVVYQHLPHYRLDVFRALSRTSGWNVHFAAGASSRDPGIALIPPTDLSNVHVLENQWIGPFLWQRGLRRVVEASPTWDAIIFLGDAAYLSTWAWAAAARRKGVLVAFWGIGWHRPDVGLRRRARLKFYGLADLLLLYGEEGREFGLQAGYPSPRMKVVGNSVPLASPPASQDADAQRALRKSLSSVPFPAVGAVVRLTPGKELEKLILAVRHIYDTHHERLSVVIAGDGPERRRLEDLAGELGVDLHLVGAIYDGDSLRDFYNTCKVSVLPSRAGLSTIQSLTYGRPVISHDFPAEQMPEFEAIRPGVNGSLYRHGDIGDLARRIRETLDISSSDSEGLKQRCHASVGGMWSASGSAERIVTAVEGAIGAR